MKTHIRPFTPGDYVVAARLWNTTFTENAKNVEDYRFEDEHRPAHCRQARWVAERDDGCLVGVGGYDQQPFVYHPRKFRLDLVVDPACLSQGIGRTLYKVVLDALQPLDPLALDAWSRQDMPCRVRFLAGHGFSEDMRVWASVLDLTTFDPHPFAHYGPGVKARGIEIKSLAELEGEADLPRRLFDLLTAVCRDLPLPPDVERTDQPFDEFVRRLNHPSKLPEAYFLAVADGQLVGVSNLWSAPEPDRLNTGLTGVRREYRRQGIAIALKLRAIEFARSRDYHYVHTDNESGNVGMLGINQQLGFVRRPAWVHYRADWCNVGCRH